MADIEQLNGFAIRTAEISIGGMKGKKPVSTPQSIPFQMPCDSHAPIWYAPSNSDTVSKLLRRSCLFCRNPVLRPRVRHPHPAGLIKPAPLSVSLFYHITIDLSIPILKYFVFSRNTFVYLKKTFFCENCLTQSANYAKMRVSNPKWDMISLSQLSGA